MTLDGLAFVLMFPVFASLLALIPWLIFQFASKVASAMVGEDE